jgi:hypothetical protein
VPAPDDVRQTRVREDQRRVVLRRARRSKGGIGAVTSLGVSVRREPRMSTALLGVNGTTRLSPSAWARLLRSGCSCPTSQNSAYATDALRGIGCQAAAPLRGPCRECHNRADAYLELLRDAVSSRLSLPGSRPRAGMGRVRACAPVNRSSVADRLRRHRGSIPRLLNPFVCLWWLASTKSTTSKTRAIT